VTCSDACARARGTATVRASGRLSGVARRRGRAAAAALLTIEQRDPPAFEALPRIERLAVRLYHGLPVDGLRVERPWTKSEVAAHLGAGCTVWQVTQALKRGLEVLLRPGEVLPDDERRARRRARISEAARARGRPAAETLRALAPTDVDRLPEPQRTIVRRFYGLESGRPWTKLELADTYGRSPGWVGRAIVQGTARLLGEQAPRPAERPCTVCGELFAPEPGAYRSARQTCGEACHRELRRRRAIASRAARRLAA
jgi:hypothetical protein